METRDHIKNGVSPKNHRSRGNFLRKTGFVLLASCIIFNGCKKDDDKNGANEKVYLVTEISSEYEDWRFEYDAQNRITKIIENDGKNIRTQTLSYNSAGDLVEIHYGDYVDAAMTFTKTGNIITYHYSWEGYEFILTFEINADKLPLKMAEEYTSNGDWYKRVNTFQYQGRNIIKFTYDGEEYWNGKLEKHSFTGTLSYDNKKSPFYHCKTPGWFFIYFWKGAYVLHNNFKTLNRSDGYTVTCEHTYNDAGFPLIRNNIGNWDDEEYEYTTETFKYEDPSESQVPKNALHETPSRPNIGNAPPKRNIWKPFSHRFDF